MTACFVFLRPLGLRLDRYASHRALVRALREGDAQAAEQIVVEDARGGLADLRRAPGDPPAAGD
ncbi:hypothetical protein GCM10023224_08140 [Streptomonospora halophila]|uniref:FCD domain-containing protein n=1 Tax=Streptomonospora halophila TaxID=427369 RepID=A0ABP9G6V3_9ACTN